MPNGLNEFAAKRRWPVPQTQLGRTCFWLGCAFLILLALRLLFGSHGAVMPILILCGIALLPLLFILMMRWLNRRALWKVRNRLIVTYALMALSPLVLFGTLTAIAGYIVAGQYSINSALLSLDEAADLLKGEVSDASGVLATPNLKGDYHRLDFDQASNPRQPEMSVAVLEKGIWKTVILVTPRGSTPPSPFDGQGKASWMQNGFHGVIMMNGKLYLCRHTIRTEDTRTVEVIGAFELNHEALNSMAISLGRVLIYSGFTKLRSEDIDTAETEAKTAEQEADAAQQTQDALRDRQEQSRHAQQQAAEGLRDARQEAAEGIRNAQRELGRAEVQRDRAQHRTSSPDEQKEAQENLGEAQAALQQVQKQAQEGLRAAAQTVAAAPPVPQGPPPQPAGPLARSDLRPPALHPAKTVKTKPSATGVQPSTADHAQSAGSMAVSGGILPPPAHLIDPHVYFTAPLPVVSWSDGAKNSAMLVVISRPGLLYTRLFSTSVEMGSILRNALVAIAILFGLVELVALWMATRLSGTITRSVAGLYRGTTEIDKGNLAFRVKPERQDQLGSLANSFNTMAGSIQDLLVQQREKERLLSELAIAQEVQKNLFPHSPVSVCGLELHAVCVPARSVSGDYFDFIFEGTSTSREGCTTCIALGDISGKGISAALLMASLHSAVRAFSLGDGAVPSPAHLLELLNRHLFSSTESNKYATLFLAFHHAESRRLTYANGGHLPPFLVSGDGSVQRLEAGGSVVGLLDGLTYSEATVELKTGDLLVAFSDGLTEPENETGEFGEDRLLALLQAHHTAPLPAITDATFRTLRQWIGKNEQPDDMTLLLVRQT